MEMRGQWRALVALVFALGALSIRTTRADAPIGRYTVTADTVLDNRTRLTWQRVATDATYTQPAAVSYCAGLSLAGGGWRLPNVMELQSLMDDTRSSPAIDAKAFPGSTGFFWTSTLWASSSNSAWYVGFSPVRCDPINTNMMYRVRCVR